MAISAGVSITAVLSVAAVRLAALFGGTNNKKADFDSDGDT